MKDFPMNWEYLRDAAELCSPAELIIESRHQEWISTMTAQQRAVLKNAWDRIKERREASQLLVEIDRREPKDMKRGPWAGLFRMVLALHTLEQKGDSGFVGVNAQFKKPEAERNLNWNTLPNHLNYLIIPAEQFGHIQSDSQIDAFCSEASEEDLDLLTKVAEQIRRDDCWDELVEWTTQHERQYPEEAQRVYSVLGLIDAVLK